MKSFIHPTAIVEEDVAIGAACQIWDNVHIRHSTQLGSQCIIGGKSYLAYGVRIGDRVKINSFVYVCHGVTIEDGVMVGAGTIFTNDRFPRATNPELTQLRPSEPDDAIRTTRVRRGASIGAGCRIGCDLEIGRFAMVGMGSVVTRPVPDFHLVIGVPSRTIGCVCRCGEVIARWNTSSLGNWNQQAICGSCGRRYVVHSGQVSEVDCDTEPTE